MPASRFLFIGDSVTDCGRRDDPEGLGFGYVRVIDTELPNGEVINRGISGHRVPDLAARWQQDVLDIPHDVTTVLVGINDTWRRYDSADPTSTEDFEARYVDLLEANFGPGPSLILMEPFVLPVDAGQEAWHREDLDEKIAVVRDLAARYGAHLVPLDAALNAIAQVETAEALAPDGVHPTERGHQLIAQLWLAIARSVSLV